MDKECLDKVGRLRDELAASRLTVAVTDYGAGPYSSTGSGASMLNGRIVDRVVGELCRNASLTQEKGAILFKLLRQLKPNLCLELGTCLGISACYQGFALALNQKGRLVTLEGAETLASIARDNLKFLGLDNVTVIAGRFLEILPELLRQPEKFDYVFIDGHHEEAATVNYWEILVPSLAPGATVVFDDIKWSEGMRRAWDRIKADSRVKSSRCVDEFGICVI